MKCQEEISLADRDRDLSGLRVLLDDDRLLEAVVRCKPEWNIVSSHANYVRYKPGTSCTVGLEFRRGDGSTLLAYAKAHRGVDAAKLRKLVARHVEGGPAPLELPDLSVLVAVFPHDAVLRGLRRLTSVSDAAAMMRKLAPSPDGSPRSWRWRSLAYKPERRCVVRLDLQDAQRPETTVAKFYDSGGMRRAAQCARAVRCRGPLCLPRILGRSYGAAALCFEWIEGRRLIPTESRHPPSRADCALVGAALAELHNQQPGPDTLRLRDCHAQAAHATAVAEFVATIAPSRARLARELAFQVGKRLLARAPRTASVTLHGDFYADQVLLLPSGRAGILDLDEACVGHPSTDLGNFTAHLHERFAGEDFIDEIHHCSAALHDGYRRHQGSTRLLDEDDNTYVALGLLDLAPRGFRQRRTTWPQELDRVLADVSRMLGVDCPAVSSPTFELLPEAPESARPRSARPAVEDPLRPLLAAALDGAVAGPLLLRAIRASKLDRGLPPPRQLRVESVQVIREKPRRRCLVSYELQTSDEHGTETRLSVIGKIRAKGVDQRQHDLLHTLQDAGFGPHSLDGVSVPTPLGMVKSLEMMLLERVNGVPATGLLSPTPAGARLARRIGQGLRKLHDCHAIRPERVHTANDELRILRDRLLDTARAEPDLARTILGLYERCEDLSLEVVDPLRSCGIHRDFYPDQVLVDGERLWLLDFDLYCQGDPALDAGNFLAHLQEQSIRNGEHDCREPSIVESAFLSEFTDGQGEGASRAIELYTLLSLTRHISISRAFPQRARFTIAIMNAVTAALTRIEACNLKHYSDC